MTDSLDLALGGPTKEITVAGKSVTLSPMKMKQLTAFAKAIQPIKEQIVHLAGDLTFENIADLLSAGPDLFKATEIATGIPIKELEELNLDEFISLAAGAISVNADFFVQRVAPAIQGTAIGST